MFWMPASASAAPLSADTASGTSCSDSSRFCAVTTAKPLSKNKVLKDYPTLQEMGLKGFDLTIWHGLYAPKGTPPAVLKKLNDALKLALKDADFLKKQEELGAVVVSDSRMEPAAHKAFVAGEIAKLKPVIEAAKEFAD